MDLVLAVGNKLSEETLHQDFLWFCVWLIHIIFLEDTVSVIFVLMLVRVDYVIVILVKLVKSLVGFGSQSMVTGDSLCNFFVLLCAFLIEDNEDQIETREQRVRHSNIFSGRILRLILSVDGIGCRNYWASCIERTMHSSLSNCDGLLLHDLMDCHSVYFIHFVKLIDAYNSSVC